ncbi:MAG: hypothetical protein HQK54_06405 [Oligoflexales bacterium]|nr:hypothetical protein [Oligoflexales bacterium]
MWTLNELDKMSLPIGWIESLITTTQYSTLEIYYYISENYNNFGLAIDSLSLFVSASIMLTKCDYITLIEAPGISLIETKALDHWGTKKERTAINTTIAAQRKINNLKKFNVLEIIPSQWWNLENGKKDKKNLNYLSMKIERIEKEENLKPFKGKKRKGAIYKLFMPKEKRSF